MRVHVSFDLYVPEEVCTFEELQQWLEKFLAASVASPRGGWTLSNVEVEER
ncbi:MAG TPA: hypothetical protein VK752_05315 [Bryobacteraceae bacterium]|jgi:hypothetical protein|nr:hypothetical protein [Bryobacteraceae bacterium]